jgi:hypothetical protein
MHEEPPQQPPKNPDNVKDFAEEKRKREEGKRNGNSLKKIGWLKGKKKGGFSGLADQEKFPEKKSEEEDLKNIVLLISEYQLKFLVKLNSLVPMSKTILNNLGENEFLKETADIRNELYDWEKKLKKAYKNLQKIPGEKSLLETVGKYLDNFKVCGLGYHDVQEDEDEAAKLMKKLKDFVERNK